MHWRDTEALAQAGSRSLRSCDLWGHVVMTSRAIQSASGRSVSGAPSEPRRIDRVATTMAVELPDGRRLSLEYWPGDGAPLVLLHGLLDCGVGWKHLAKVMHRPCYAVDLPGFGDSDRPTRNRISAYAEDMQAALAVHDFTLVGHSLGGAVAAAMAERLREDVVALVLMAPVGFGHIHLAEAIQVPGVRTLARHGLPLALPNPVTAFGVYMAVVGNGHLPDPELIARLRKNAHRWAPGALCANEAVSASGRSRRAFYRRQLDYHGPVLALWGQRDRLVPLAHREGVMTAFPQAQISVWKKMGHHPQRERPGELARFIEAACGSARPRLRGAASGGKPPLGRVPAPTPQPLTADGAGELPAVA
jgi:pimeloyl-ACP methyl ester carboxylesterase